MNFKRNIESTLKDFAKFPVVVLLGPRQSGKTTLVQNIFKKHKYVNLEDPETLELITTDPKKFLRDNENKYGIIVDEFQHAPKFLSYVQIESDTKDRPGYFVLTGSQNFLMNQAISQSLAGRAGILTLLPLSLDELDHNDIMPITIDELIIKGGYPRLFTKKITPKKFFPSYISTYVERDVRQLTNVGNLATFQKFMKLCAGRVGQLINMNDLATNCSINQKTVKEWLSILEASYIIFSLKPYFNNFNKRLTKTPKLYFYDTGLVCNLLGIKSAEELSNSPFRGHLFECLIIADFYKQYYNLGLDTELSFWRDQNGLLEIDCLIGQYNKIVPVEIKSGETIISNFFKNMQEWCKITGIDSSTSCIVYGGQLVQNRSAGKVINIKTAGKLVTKKEKD